MVSPLNIWNSFTIPTDLVYTKRSITRLQTMGVPQSFQKIIVKPLWLLQYCSAYPVAVAFSSYLFGKHQVEKDVGSWEDLFKRTYVEKCSKEIGSLSSEFCRIFAQVLLRSTRPSPHVAWHEACVLWLSLSILCILVSQFW